MALLGGIVAASSAFRVTRDCFGTADALPWQGFLDGYLGQLAFPLLEFPVYLFATLMTFQVAADQLAFSRQTLTWRQLFVRSARRLGPYIGASILQALLLISLIAPGAIAYGLGQLPVAIALWIGVGAVGLRLVLRRALYTGPVLFENASASEALSRSRHLTEGHLWRVLEIIVLVAVVDTILTGFWSGLSDQIGPWMATALTLSFTALTFSFGQLWMFVLYAALCDRKRTPEPQ